MHLNKKAFTLVEMLVALAVSSIIVAATYASFELIQKQYKKNIDVAELHTSGRAIMTILEREIRMAGYEVRDDKGLMTYGSIIGPLVIKDSQNKCCDEVTIIYDEVFDILNASGVVTSSTVERVKTRFWTEPYNTSKHGARNRLFKRRTILGTNNALLARPRVGAKEVMADYIEDLQITNISTSGTLYSGTNGLNVIKIWNPTKPKNQREVGSIRNTGYVDALAFGPDGLLYSGTNGLNVIKIWDPTKVKNQREVGSIRNTGYVDALAFSPDGRIYSGTDGLNVIKIWDPSKATNQKQVGNINSSGYVDALAFGPDGLLYSGTNGLNVIKIWNKAGVEVDSIRNTGYVDALAFSPDGLLYSGTNGLNVIKIWDPTKVKNQREVGSIRNTGYVDALAFGPDGLLYSANDGNNVIKIWDPSKATNQKQVGTISNTGPIDAMVFNILKTGQIAVVNIDLTLRTKGAYGQSRQFLKKEYFNGNFNFNKNDKYFRDTLSTTVSVRNL